jgi:hypothetical protein
MYLRIANRIINAGLMTDAEVSGEEAGRPAVEIRFSGAGPGLAERVVRLEGEDARAFLRAIPVYRPTDED